MIDKQMKLSEHFTLREMTRTKTRIENVPNEGQVENLKWLCRWLEMLRSEWNKRYGDGDDPIIITSAFRCKAVNEAVGGSPKSNHLLGCAADIRCAGIEQALRYATIILDVSDEGQEPFDELIIEKSGSVYWVHFAVRPEHNRCKVLLLQKK